MGSNAYAQVIEKWRREHPEDREIAEIPNLNREEAIQIIVRYRQGCRLGPKFYGNYRCPKCNALWGNIYDWAWHAYRAPEAPSHSWYAISEMERIAKGYLPSDSGRVKEKIYRKQRELFEKK